jgi:hypothetical protein
MTGRRQRLAASTALLASLLASLLGAFAPAASASLAGGPPAPVTPSGRVIRVPRDAPTIQHAVDRARAGDLVLVSAGVYRESVVVRTSGIVVRGADRNRTILDGQHKRKNGIDVERADGVAVENLTARNFTENGFYWNGVRGYRGSYLTAYRNREYGVYAFDSSYGQFDHSYASGSGDSGFYIGQCNPCFAIISDVVSEYNQLGYSGTNSSGSLAIVRSVWRKNRAGIVPNSLDDEQLAPQGHMVIAGNQVDDSGNADAAQPLDDQLDVLYGSGIVVVGGIGDVIVGNRVSGSAGVGIGIAPNPGLGGHVYPAVGNRVTGNTVQGSLLADLGILLPGPGDGNCFAANTFTTSAPRAIEQAAPCDGAPTADVTNGALDLSTFLSPGRAPKGRRYRTTPVPAKQETLRGASTAPARPATDAPVRSLLPAGVELVP